MSKSRDFQIRTTYDLSATMAVGQLESTAVDLQGVSLGGFLIPSGFTATSLTFKGSIDGTNFFSLKDLKTNSDLLGLCEAGKIFLTSAVDFAFVRYIKIVGNTAQVSSDKIIQLLTRSID